jgi:hypothetical protein
MVRWTISFAGGETFLTPFRTGHDFENHGDSPFLEGKFDGYCRPVEGVG